MTYQVTYIVVGAGTITYTMVKTLARLPNGNEYVSELKGGNVTAIYLEGVRNVVN